MSRVLFNTFGAGALIAMALASGAARADSMRCGKWVVNELVTPDELLTKCGQPQNRDVKREDVYAVNPNGARIKTGAVSVKERWIYKPSPGTLPMAVLIVDGKITSLARTD